MKTEKPTEPVKLEKPLMEQIQGGPKGCAGDPPH
jgi:hypothetical protein